MSEIDKQNSHRKKISAFALSQKSFDIRAEIGVQHVLSFRPEWTEAQAEEFLRQHGDSIGEDMAMAGMVVLAMLLQGGRYDN